MKRKLRGAKYGVIREKCAYAVSQRQVEVVYFRPRVALRNIAHCARQSHANFSGIISNVHILELIGLDDLSNLSIYIYIPETEYILAYMCAFNNLVWRDDRARRLVCSFKSG